MTCDDARAAMDAEFAGDAPPERAAPLREHLRECASCRERYDRLARVEARLSGGGLSEQKRDVLQALILARSAPVPSVVAPPPLVPRRWGLLLAAAAVLVVSTVAVFSSRATREDPFTPRGATGRSWGVRAFCVRDGHVTGEALAGGTLVCGEGALVQFTYTAPQPATLTLSLDGTAQTFVSGVRVSDGTDVALPTSTPVGAWLSGPMRVTARFTDDAGGTLAERTLSLTPR